MQTIFLRDHDVPYVSFGRPIEWSDIADRDAQPLEVSDEGRVHCFHCDRTDSRKLTRSTGVFTSAVLCPDQAPVYMCLEHMPWESTSARFGWLKPEAAKLLQEAVKAREMGIRTHNEAIATLRRSSTTIAG